MKDKFEKYFGESKKPTTFVKHRLFNKLLNTSIGIANNISLTRKRSKVIYTYLDLYAGIGYFEKEKIQDYEEDIEHKLEKFGSPLIALEAIKNFYESFKERKIGIDKFLLIFCESTDPDSLKENVEQYIHQSSLLTELERNQKLICYIHPGNWEEISDDLKKIWEASDWGTIFIDPFALEVEGNLLTKTFSSSFFTKEVVFFLNLGHMTRGLSGGMGGFENTARNICKFFDIPKEVFKEIWKKIIEVSEQKSLKPSEQVQILAFILITELISRMRKGPYECINTMLCLPLSVKGKLVNWDYYGLLFSSGVPAIIDSVIKEYRNCIKIKDKFAQTPLFSLTEDILTKFLAQLKRNELSLYELLKKLWGGVYSWNAAINVKSYPPTLTEIRKFLNKKIDEQVIKVYFNTISLDRIKSEYFRKVEDLKNIKIVCSSTK